MIRDILKKNYMGLDQGFRFRGEESSRLENLSDGVFALAITMVLISTSQPTNFSEVVRFTQELIPFCICMAMVMIIWHEHFIYFLRYGLRGGRIVLFNTILLGIVLFFVYPLKFLAKITGLYFMYILIDGNESIQEINHIIGEDSIDELMIIYGIGGASVFLLLGLMYRYALSQREVLQLNVIETFDTKSSYRMNILRGIVPLSSVAAAILFRDYWFAGVLAGMIYLTYIPLFIWYPKSIEKKRARLLDSTDFENHTQ